MARRHLLFLLSGAVAEELETHRRHWDPVMAERAPAHVTLVYPEEVDDEPLLRERAATAAEHVAPFSIWLGAPAAADSGRGGVWFSVEDPSDSWHQLREMILAPPLTPISVTPHATVVHPRTSDLGLQAAASLHHTRIGGESPLTELLLTETDRTGTRVVRRFPLTGQSPIRVVAGILRRKGQLLLCHRHPGRTNYPDVWDFPGGHIEDGEAITEALARELQEDLGVLIDPPQVSPWETIRVDDVELNLYILDHWEGEPDNKAIEEHDKIRWVAPNDISRFQLAHRSYPQLLQRAAEHF